MLEAIIYAHACDSDEPGYTIEQQQLLCEVAWKSEPGPVIARLEDVGTKRPKLRKARSLCHARKACLIVHSLDRLGTVRVVMQIASALLRHNCHLISVLDRLDTIESPPQDALRAIVTIRRMRETKPQNIYWLTHKRGKGKAPFGWIWSNVKGRLVKIGKLQHARKRAIELEAKSWRLTDIAEILNIEFPRDQEWAWTDVHAILMVENRIERHKAAGTYCPD